jgi:cell division protein FtsB
MTLREKQNFTKAMRKEKDGVSKKRRKFNFEILNKCLFCLILSMGVYYVVSINDLAIKGFVLQELKSEVQDLKEDNTQIQLAVMKLESYENIEKRAQELNMVKVGKIDYITVNNSSVAKK